jgi:uncharacterized protein
MSNSDDSKRELWGHHLHRFGGNAARPHRLLLLDGGGIRGALTLEILAEIESPLATITGKGKAFRISDYFDYIGGTSTGAIIGAGLSIGTSVKQFGALVSLTA